MDLLKHRNDKDKKNQDVLKEVLNGELVQRYRFGSLAEMSLIRDLALDQIMKGKIKNQEQLLAFDQTKETLKEYFYVEKVEQIDANDYIRYLTFNDKPKINDKSGDKRLDFELKKGGLYVNSKDGFIILKSSNPLDKKTYWKISDKTPLFCKLNDNDKIIMVLMENIHF
jgi:hypothetical protein